MSATISTQPQHRVPLATALAVVGFVVAAGALGVAWEKSNDSPAPAQAPAARHATLQDYMKYDYFHGENAQGLKHQETFGTPGPNSRSVDVGQRPAPTPNSRSVDVGQRPAPTPNSRSVEVQQQQQAQQSFQSPPGGRTQMGN